LNFRNFAKKLTLLVVAPIFLLTGCNLANHGSFVTQTFSSTDWAEEQTLTRLGPVEGKSCQTAALYFIPQGDSTSTNAAIADAKGQRAGTLLLADVSIDDKLWLEFGYSVQCILVSATAYGVAP